MMNLLMMGYDMLTTDFRDQNSLLINLVVGKHPVIIDKETGEAHIPGRRGRIEPYSNDGKVFCMYTDGPQILKEMIKLDWVTEHQIGDDEGYVLFKREDFKKAKKFLKLRTTRKLSEEHKAKLAASNKPYRYGSMISK